MSILAIYKAVGKNYTTVKRWIQKFNQTGNLEIKKAGGGRPKRITPRVEQFIRNQYSKDKSLTYLQITQRLRKLKKVGKSTIARFCKAHGTKYLPKKQYILSEVNKEKRREYARYLKGGKLADIIWSDESKFDLNRNKKRYFRFKNKPRVGKTVFNPNQSIMVWGAVSSMGRISLVEVEDRLNATKYSQILSENLFEQGDRLYGPGQCSLSQSKNCHEDVQW